MPGTIVLVTCVAWPELSASDRCLAEALERRGWRVEAAHRLDPARTFNAPDLVRWNLEKTYLNELAARGARIPVSLVVDADARAIALALEQLALADAVIKPTVGASGFGVERVSRGGETEAVARLRAVASSPRVLVQEFLIEVATAESAGVFIAGVFSHGLRRGRVPCEQPVRRPHGGRRARRRDGRGYDPDPAVPATRRGERAGARAPHLAPGAGDRCAEALLARVR